jgi:ATP-binding protein involved in chromosome partitioning
LSLVDDTRILLAAAGKGGVGKSTTAIGTAIALARRGLAVGLLDLDIRAPNVTYLLRLPDKCEMEQPGGRPIPQIFAFQPARDLGMRLPIAAFSPAMLFREGGSILMGGNALRSLVMDMLTVVAWPRLDWLVVDMDPAPGDSIRAVRDAARHVLGLVVTTPDKTSVEDARRMLDAFAGMGIRTVGMIGNMVGLRCPNCNSVIMDGGSSAEMDRAAREFGTKYLVHFPWDSEMHDDPVSAANGRFSREFDVVAAAAVAAGG